MVQIPLRCAHRLRVITLASPIKKLRPHPTERAPTAWHTNDEYKNAEASEEASASSAVANASETRILPIPTPRHWLHQSCSYKRVSSVGHFYDGLRAARWRAERPKIMPQRRTPLRAGLSNREVSSVSAPCGRSMALPKREPRPDSQRAGSREPLCEHGQKR